MALPHQKGNDGTNFKTIRKSRSGKAVNVTNIHTQCANGGTKFDGGKAPFAMLNQGFMEGIARVMGGGEKKYGRLNWQGLDMEPLISAIYRHTKAFVEGEELDADSGLEHLHHVAANCMILSWLAKHGKPEQDDRRWKPKTCRR